MTDEHANEESPGKGLRVLVVDDDPDFIFQQRIQLKAAGFDVVEAASLEEARKIIADTRFDLALVDLMMEQTDAGFRLSREIKNKDAGIPVILITAVASETGMEFGASTKEERSWIKADAVLAKPVRFEQLLREIKRLLKGRK